MLREPERLIVRRECSAADRKSGAWRRPRPVCTIEIRAESSASRERRSAMRRTIRFLCLLWLALLPPLAARAETPVDLELVLAVDCSGSIDDDEFALQIRGYAAAFAHPAIIAAIRSGEIGALPSPTSNGQALSAEPGDRLDLCQQRRHRRDPSPA